MRFRPLLLALLLAVLATACHKKVVRAIAEDSRSVVEDFRHRPVPFALQARFSFSLQGPQLSGASTGVLVLHAPDRFRLEILTPLSTPLMVIASDGQHLNAYRHDEQVFYRGDDAPAVLSSMLAGQVGVSDILALITGGLPLPDAPIVEATDQGDHTVRAVLQGPEDVQVVAILAPRRGILSELGVVRQSEPVVVVHYGDDVRLRRVHLPEEVTIEMPALGWTLSLAVQSWDELGVIPDAFTLAPPKGAEERDLVQTLTDLRQQAARPSP